MEKILRNNDLSYRVVDAKGKVLKECSTVSAAESFIDSLDDDVREGVMLIPITPSGDQVLFG